MSGLSEYERIKAEKEAERQAWRQREAAIGAERKAAREAEIARKQVEHEQRQAQHAALIEAQRKNVARARWLASGGAAAEFERNWPPMWARILEHEALQTPPPLVRL